MMQIHSSFSPRPLALVLLVLHGAALPAGAVQLASVNAAGTATGNSPSSSSALSANGRFVAFQSAATDLVPGGSSAGNLFVRDLLLNTTVLASVNEPPFTGLVSFPRLSADGRYLSYERTKCSFFFCPSDVFVRDLQANTTTLVSVGVDGQPAGGFQPLISADGRHVAFQSISGNLVAHDSNGAVDVFVRDLDAGVTQLASLNAAGSDSGNAASGTSSISADGRFVAFQSDASDLVGGDGNGATDVFVRDLQAGVTYLASGNLAGTGSGNGVSQLPALSADGSRVAFVSAATDLVAADGNGEEDVFVRDLPAGPTRLVSVNMAGTDSGNGISGLPFLTPNGRFVTFLSQASDLAPLDPANSGRNIFQRDLETGVTLLVTPNAFAGPVVSTANPVLYSNFRPKMGVQVSSDDGRYVVFASDGTEVVSGLSLCEYEPCYQVYRRDLQAGVTTLLSASPGDQSENRDNFGDEGAQISGDGRVVVFQTQATNLVPLPDGNNGADVFSTGAPAIPPVAVPTLGGSALALLALLFAGLGVRALSKERPA
jgi:Tol biopolymer transport system component